MQLLPKQAGNQSSKSLVRWAAVLAQSANCHSITVTVIFLAPPIYWETDSASANIFSLSYSLSSTLDMEYFGDGLLCPLPAVTGGRLPPLPPPLVTRPAAVYGLAGGSERNVVHG